MAEAGKGRSRKIERVRGTQDLLPEESARWWQAEHIIREILSVYGFGEIRTPAFESADLFHRPLGEGSDVIAKEMYEFEDKGGRRLALRPEGTAPVVRAYVEHGLYAKGGRTKLFYFGPIFRYDRPQAGRYRQHHQVGIEAFGDPGPAQDAEVVEVAVQILAALGVDGYEIKVNSCGCPECRPNYEKALRSYLTERRSNLCEDCAGHRLDKNPLRVLDCKVPSCKKETEGAPPIGVSLCVACKKHHVKFRECLQPMKVHDMVKEDPRLVRGFDYYTRTCFEFAARQGSRQDALVGGGRYDGLVKLLGGPDTPAVGFGMGLERVIASSTLSVAGAGLHVFVTYAKEESFSDAYRICSALRARKYRCLLAQEGKSLGSQMKAAGGSKANYAVILGLAEAPAGQSIRLRHLGTGQEDWVSEAELPEKLGR